MTLACPYCGQTAGAIAGAPIHDLSPFWPWCWKVQVGGIFKCCNCGKWFKYRRGVVSRSPEQPTQERASDEAVPDLPRQREPSRVPVGGDDDMPLRRRPIR